MTEYPMVAFRLGTLAEPIAQRGKPATPLGQIGRRDIERYYRILSDDLATVSLDEREALALCDALNGSLLDQTTYRYVWAELEDAPHLAAKWGVDMQRLVRKLRDLTPGQTMAIIDAVERWWLIQDSPSYQSYQESLARVGLIR